MWDSFWQFLIDHYIFHTVVVVAVIFIIFGRYSRIHIGKNGLEVIKNRHGERDDQQDKTLDIILQKVDGMEERMTGMSKLVDTALSASRAAVVQASTGVVWADKNPPFMEVIKAGLTGLMFEQNGNLVIRMKEVIIGYNDQAEMYRSILKEFIDKNKGKLSDYFYESIAEIKAGIY